MKLLMIVAASLALALAGCNRDQSSAGRTAQPKAPSSAAGGSSMPQTPSGATTGQKSEGSTDKSTAPKQPEQPGSK
ncbi:MAG TPA: hypothetical protein VGJ74_03630 [Burkholderiales bacterium]|jgi:ABC-type oligopeptide transport system substrate-binding subunit